MDRMILHVDLDALYASLEELRRPEIRGKPVVVCVYSGRTEDSGAVATSNYKARELGIKAGMPIAFAKRAAKGKDVVFLPVDLEHYREVSDRIMDILEAKADKTQQVSIDEAYLDVSESCKGEYSCAEGIAKEIKADVREQEGVTCSVGIAPNKFLAKMAGKKQKPDGLTIVRLGEEKAFLSSLPVGKLHGIGGKTVDELNELGVTKTVELAATPLSRLEEKFGRNKAKLLHEKARGIDDSPVEQKEKQQLSRIATLKMDSSDPGEIYEKIALLCADLDKKLQKDNLRFKTISLIIIDTHLQAQTRSETIPETDSACSVLPSYKGLIEKFFAQNPGRVLRRAGIRVSNLTNRGAEKKQKKLFDY